ncbi:protein kinase domain-containing protein [Aureliella helgolandensis]|uniref:Serine/threonine-protein kinase PknB n=1 Tax=Aureliella helgolandensis TaxID=2527968 RepID=A0A518GG27_9BACT|nr:protein kinase [Aureliella helgolandensis]QDV27530.1 Serine/threonine-protein kinase PknB [Aureliella helgolandensis]
MMTATVCPNAAELQALSTGQLEEKQSQALFDHIQACDHCRTELETLEDSADSLIASLRGQNDFQELEQDPGCQLAVAKALGALVQAAQSPTATEFPDFPRQLGEYEIVRPLGRGGMGCVYLAQHTKLGRLVALKVLQSHRLADVRMRERFENEMRAVGRLSHPNVVTAHDAREVDGMAVLVTEYIDGFDLGQLSGLVGPLPIADACEIVRRVAVALEYTHQQGFVHRDIKPSNIMLSRQGEVKLLDLGLARLQFGDGQRAEMTGTGQTMGTADYIAPEQVTDSRHVDIRADIYALGCTLFKLLTGSAPFADEHHPTAFAKMTAHVSTLPPSLKNSLDGAPHSLAKLVDTMLGKSPASRPQKPLLVANVLKPLALGHDLPKLIQQAEEQPQTTRATVSSPSRSAVETQPLLFRRIPVWCAVAAGFSSFVLGVCLGVLITIRYPDGTESTFEVPSGSQVTQTYVPDGTTAARASSGSPESPQPPAATPPPLTTHEALDVDVQETMDVDIVEPITHFAPRIVFPAGYPEPLRFAILVTELDDENLERAQAKLANSEDMIVPTQWGVWYPVLDDISVSISSSKNGVAYALTSATPADHIAWGNIAGHISVMTKESRDKARGTQLDLQFTPPLSKEFERVTGNNLSKNLAIIINGVIASSPRIRGKLSTHASLTGKFPPEEIRYFMQSLDGGLVEPLQRPTMASGKDESSSLARYDLKAIGIAFHNFHDVYQKLPGSLNFKEGTLGWRPGTVRPPVSWRVVLLPFIEQNELFEQYRFDEPWDSESNLKLLDKMPEVYRSPRAPKDQAAGETNYQGFVGEHTALGNADGEPFREFLDGTSNTILLVETASSVPWTKPQDIPFSEVKDIESGKWFAGPINVLLADGACLTLEQPLNLSDFAKRITRDGGEFIAGK